MYLPPEIPKARVLITVKTYPLPSGKYEELVCTAGVLEDGVAPQDSVVKGSPPWEGDHEV
jgi:hypothetical protein